MSSDAGPVLYPAMVVQIGSREALREIRELTIVEAAEPLYLPQGIGCALDPYTLIAADGDFFGNRIPWSFSHLGIVEAWNLYKQANTRSTTRAGIRIGVIDTGVFEDEHQLITAFNPNGARPDALHHTVVLMGWPICAVAGGVIADLLLTSAEDGPASNVSHRHCMRSAYLKKGSNLDIFIDA